MLCFPHTFSSAYTMMRKLHAAGAILLGSTSAQAHEGFSFGSARLFHLKNSGIRLYVSQSQYTVNHIFQPDYRLTYAKLAELKFDRNAEILYALEIASKLN